MWLGSEFRCNHSNISMVKFKATRFVKNEDVILTPTCEFSYLSSNSSLSFFITFSLEGE
jgi:hypothetical protein